MRRSELRRRSRLRPQSRKQARRDRAWRHTRRMILNRDGWRCRRCGWGDATGDTLHVHHLDAGGMGRGKDDRPDNLVTLCAGPGTPDCHGRTHAYPAESYEHGWLIRSGGGA